MEIDGRDAARRADLQQAWSLRRELVAERRQVIDRIGNRRELIRNGDSTSRAIAEMHRAEDDLIRLDEMIDRLDRRFALQPDDVAEPS
ncbi:hypothetical protein [Mycolicibacterium chlorophenolicum]|nr:hypothetical protein [Mycolicibacterium chlorophenolicum]